ncbi:MAG TPA: peptidase [Blastocatellia bacterium]|nr:peptidase [Blastocatellia bacterium]
MSILLIFIDGVGIGTRGNHNPIDGSSAQIIQVFQNEEFRIPFDGVLAVTDAHLGVDGKPQSATGQTTILTGINAPAFLGQHLSGFPGGSLRSVIQEHSIMKELKNRGRRVVFANAYAPRFFEKRPRFVSASTIANEAAEMPFRSVEDLKTERAVYHDFTHSVLKGSGVPIHYRSPEDAGKILARIASESDFCFYEYFMTDFAGHSRDFDFARSTIEVLDQFLLSVLAQIDLSKHVVILTSDHGNIEDMTTKSHTDNKVATMVWGSRAAEMASKIRSLCDIAPTILAEL